MGVPEQWSTPVQVLDLEEEGKLNMTVRLKKRALQGAYDQAIKKKKVKSAAAALLVPGYMQPVRQPCSSQSSVIVISMMHAHAIAALDVHACNACCRRRPCEQRMLCHCLSSTMSMGMGYQSSGQRTQSITIPP